MKTIKKIILAAALIGVAECAHAVTGAIITDLITRGSTTTVRCSQNSDRGKIFVDTDAVSGQQIYACEGSSGWKLQGDGGGAGSGDIEGVTAGNGLTGGGASGTVTLNVDYSSVPSRANALLNSTSVESKTLFVTSGSVTGQFSPNSIKWPDGTIQVSSPSASAGDIEGVTAGPGLSGGGTSGTVTLSLNPNATHYIHNQNTLQDGASSYLRNSYVEKSVVIGTGTFAFDTSTGAVPVHVTFANNTEGYGVDHNTFMDVDKVSATGAAYMDFYDFTPGDPVYHDKVASWGYTGTGARFQFRDSADTVAAYIDVDESSGTIYAAGVQFDRLAAPQPNAVRSSQAIQRNSYFHRVHADTLPVIVTMPSLSGIDGALITKHQYIFCKADTSSNTVTFTGGDGNDTVDSNATLNYPNQCVILISSITGGTSVGKWFVAMKSNADLSTPGVINVSTNPIDWSLLKNVPAGFADGTDDGAGGGGSSIYNATSTAGFPYGFTASSGVFTSSVVAYAYYLYVPGTGIQSTQNNRFDFFTNGILWGSINSDGDWSFGGVETYDRDHLLKADGSVVFNDQGLNADHRIESSVSDSSFFLEGSNGNVGIGTNTPVNKLDIYGVVRSTGLIMRNLSPGVMYVVNGSSVVETAASGTINTSTNPVDWTLLKNVPAGFADGVDATGGGGGTTIVVQEGGSTVVETSTLTFNSDQFNIADLTGKGSVVIDTMTTGGIMALSTGTNSAGQLLRLDSSADVPDANLSASVSLLGSQIDISGETNLTASNGITLMDDALSVNWSSAISRSDVVAAYQPLDATLTDLAAAPLTEDNSIDPTAIAAGALPSDVTVTVANMANSDHGAFTYLTNIATLDSGVVTAANMANADHGDVSWSGGFATVDSVAAANVAAGVLGSSVRASSFPVSGVSPGTYGSATQVATFTVNAQGFITQAGNITITGGAASSGSTAQSTGTANIYIDAAAFQVLQSSFAPLSNISTTTTKSAVRLFDDTAREYVDFKFRVPAQLMNDANVNFRADVGAVTAAASKNTKFDLEYYCAANGESWQGALSTTTSGNFPLSATQDIVTQATWTATITSLGWSAGDVCFARLSRDPAATADLTGDVRLYGLSIGIPINASGSNFFNKTYNAAQANLPGSNSPYISNSTSSASAGVFFDETSTQSVTWSDILSPYNGGTLNADVIFLSSATSGTMNWGVYLECITSNVDAVSGETDSFGVVNSTSVTVGATSLMSNKATVALTNGDSCASGDEIRVKLERQAQSLDTAVGKGRVRRLRIYETP